MRATRRGDPNERGDRVLRVTLRVVDLNHWDAAITDHHLGAGAQPRRLTG
jgi:hypothetical protein